MGFRTYSSVLCDVIQHSKPQFAIGIFGSWGSGKTTLMHAMMDELQSEFRHFTGIVVDFSAWRYEKEEHLIVPLIDTIREAVLKWSGDRSRSGGESRLARTTAERLGKISRAFVAGLSIKAGLPNAMEISFDANKAISSFTEQRAADAGRVPRSFYHAGFKALSEVFREFKADSERRIVVFIDDLDRCLPKGALEVFESMKLFFDLPGFVFVLGLDRRVVEWCIEASYMTQFPSDGSRQISPFKLRGTDYINKMFQVSFALPPVREMDLDGFLKSVVKTEMLADSDKKELTEIVRPHLRYVTGDAGLNPRRLKQYINDYAIQMSISPRRDNSVVLAILTINYRDDWSAVRSALYADDRDMVLKALRQPTISGQRQELKAVDPDYAGIPDDFFAYIASDTGNGVSGPAHPLLKVANLSEYLYAEETTRSAGSNPALLDVLQRVSRLRGLLVEAVTDDGSYRSQAMDTFHQELSATATVIQSVVLGAYGSLALSNLKAVENALGEVTSKGRPEERLEWRKQQMTQLKSARQILFSVHESTAGGTRRIEWEPSRVVEWVPSGGSQPSRGVEWVPSGVSQRTGQTPGADQGTESEQIRTQPSPGPPAPQDRSK